MCRGRRALELHIVKGLLELIEDAHRDTTRRGARMLMTHARSEMERETGRAVKKQGEGVLLHAAAGVARGSAGV